MEHVNCLKKKDGAPVYEMLRHAKKVGMLVVRVVRTEMEARQVEKFLIRAMGPVLNTTDAGDENDGELLEEGKKEARKTRKRKHKKGGMRKIR